MNCLSGHENLKVTKKKKNCQQYRLLFTKKLLPKTYKHYKEDNLMVGTDMTKTY